MTDHGEKKSEYSTMRCEKVENIMDVENSRQEHTLFTGALATIFNKYLDYCF